MTPHPHIARVCIDSPLPHLDRLFDYAIPEKLVGIVQSGTRVRVRFAGRLVNAVVWEVASDTDFEGTLQPLNSAAARPSFSASGLALAGAIARRYGGARWDVLRLMAPPRVAAVEKRDWVPLDEAHASEQQGRLTAALDATRSAWEAFGGPAVLKKFSHGARRVWNAVPWHPTAPRDSVDDEDAPFDALVAAAVVGSADGASSIVVVPDERSLDRLGARLTRAGLRMWNARRGGDVARIHTSDGVGPRYGAYLAALTGQTRIVIGTRPAAMVNVPRAGLVVVWDDGNTGFDDPHAPYPHARTIAAMRAETEGSALLLGGFAETVHARALVEHGWAKEASASRTHVRDTTPAVHLLTDQQREQEGPSGRHWMPGHAWRKVVRGLENGPVAILAPRAGYVRASRCARCQEPAVCRTCGDGIELGGSDEAPTCIGSGHPNLDWHCGECHSEKLAFARLGIEAMGEQIRSMVSGAPVVLSSSGTGVLPDAGDAEGIIIATPAALPRVVGGYAHLVVVDASALVGAGVDGEADAVRFVLNAAALVRPRGQGGGVTVVGRVPDRVSRALSTWSPSGFAQDEYHDRSEIGFPPQRRVVRLEGNEGIVSRAVDAAREGTASDDVRAVPGPGGQQLLCTRAATQGVVDRLRVLQRELSKAGNAELRMRVDAPLVPAA